MPRLKSQDKTQFWNFAKSADEEIELHITGEIMSDDNGWFYEWLGIPVAKPIKFRNELSMHTAKDISVWIDSWGGDVFAGVGIYNALKEHEGKVTVKVNGKAVSAGSLIAMAGDEILMSPGSIMMIHNPWSQAVGEAKDMIKAAEMLNEVKEAILNVYETRVKGKDRGEISRLMDNEEWMSAKKAVSEGFADGILHLEDQKSEEANNDFSISRFAIMNSADDVMRRFFDQYKQVQAASQDECENADDGSENGDANNEHPVVTGDDGGDETVSLKTIEDLKNQFPELYKSTYDAGAAEGIKNERERITDIEDLVAPGNEAIIAEAKASGASAMDTYKKIVAADKDRRTQAAASQKEDSKTSNVAKVAAAAATQEEGEEDEDKEAKNLASGVVAEMKRLRGVKND